MVSKKQYRGEEGDKSSVFTYILVESESCDPNCWAEKTLHALSQCCYEIGASSRIPNTNITPIVEILMLVLT